MCQKGVKMQRKSYNMDFKLQVVSLFKKGMPQKDISSQLGISPANVNRWIKAYSSIIKVNGKEYNAEKIKEMELRLQQLEKENSILKKTSSIIQQTKTV